MTTMTITVMMITVMMITIMMLAQRPEEGGRRAAGSPARPQRPAAGTAHMLQISRRYSIHLHVNVLTEHV